MLIFVFHLLDKHNTIHSTNIYLFFLSISDITKYDLANKPNPFIARNSIIISIELRSSANRCITPATRSSKPNSICRLAILSHLYIHHKARTYEEKCISLEIRVSSHTQPDVHTDTSILFRERIRLKLYHQNSSARNPDIYIYICMQLDEWAI